MGIGMNDQNRRSTGSRDTRLPRLCQSDVACCEQAGQIGERAAVSDQPCELARRQSDLFTDRFDNTSLDRTRPRPHFIDGHDLIRGGADGIEQGSDG